jgi:hypothetical protein
VYLTRPAQSVDVFDHREIRSYFYTSGLASGIG